MHLTKDCKNERRSRQCSQKHHTLLHLTSDTNSPCAESLTESETTKTVPTTDVTSHIVSKITAPKTAVLLATARVRVYSIHDRVVHARALLDQGSAATLISERLAQLLRLPRNTHSVCVTGVGNLRSHARYTAYIKLSPANKLEPMFSANAIILKSLTSYTPDRIPRADTWPHVADLDLADNDILSADPIDIIIGADLYSALILEGIRGKPDEPLAQNTVLGWILSGPTSPSTSASHVHIHHGTIIENLDSNLRRFWEIEDLPATLLRGDDEKLCEDIFYLRTLEINTADISSNYPSSRPFLTILAIRDPPHWLALDD